jgi:hypothetical protein
LVIEESDSKGRMLARYAILAVPLLTAACAAMPGYSPPPFKEASKHSKPMESGDVQADGNYEMSADEKAMDCKRIAGSMQITISRLRDPYSRMEPSSGARVAQSTATPVFGGSNIGADRERMNERDRAKLEAYNRELASRNCKQLDIEAELSRAPDQPGKKY